MENNEFGVPQSSTLDILLFIIDKDDVGTSGNHLDAILYADQTALINKQDIDTLKAELTNVDIWLMQIKTFLITDQTKMIRFKNSAKTTNQNAVKLSGKI